jgi:hypothetical protein
MHKLILGSFVLLAAAGALLPTPAAAQDAADSVAIHRVVDGYISGWREADVERLSEVFAPEGRVMWVQDDQLATSTFAEVLGNRRPRPGYGEPWRLLSLSIAGDRVAVAEVWIAGASVNYVDFLTLYKIGDTWRIVTKAFTVLRD